MNTIKVKVLSVSSESDDCLACIMRTIMRSGCIVGVSPIFCICDHSKTPIVQKFIVSKFYFVLSSIEFIILACSAVLNIVSLVSRNLTKAHLIQVIVLILFEMAVNGDYAVTLLRVKIRVKELNSLIAIINNKENYGLTEIFSKPVRKKLRNISRIYMLIVFIVTIVHVCLIIILTDEKDSDYTLYRSISSLICLTTLIIHIFQFSFKMILLKTMMDAIHLNIKDCFNRRLLGQNSKKNNFPLLRTIREMQKMHCVIVFNCKAFSDLLHPFLLYEFIINTFMAITGYYLLSVIWILGMKMEPLSLMTEFSLFVILATIMCIVVAVSALSSCVSIYIFLGVLRVCFKGKF